MGNTGECGCQAGSEAALFLGPPVVDDTDAIGPDHCLAETVQTPQYSNNPQVVLEGDQHVQHSGSRYAEDHQLLIAEIGTQTAADQLTECVAPEQGRGHNAQGAQVGLKGFLHQRQHQVDVLATVVEE